MNILITGGCGFVGSNLAIWLAGCAGNKVIALDNLKRRGSELNIEFLQRSGVRFIHGDVRSLKDLDSVDECDLLIECAAEPSVHAGYDKSPSYVVDTNLFGTVNCLEFVRKRKSGIIFLSTSRVYSIHALRSLPLVEKETRLDLEQDIPGCSPQGVTLDFSSLGSRSIYGATKLASELLIEEYGAMYDVPYIINRCGVISGPRQMGTVAQGFVSLWLARHLWKGSLSYRGFGGTGYQVRDILHVSDLALLIGIQMENLQRLKGKVWVVGGGRNNSISLRELTVMCRDITGNTISIDEYPDTAQADIPWYISDNTAVSDDTGWKPQQSMTSLLNEMHSWLTANADTLVPFFMGENRV